MDPSSSDDVLLENTQIPPVLGEVEPPCRSLYQIGTLPPDAVPRVAVVGSRTPSPSGRALAYEIGRGLAEAGVVVVSGLARGIDSASHQGCLDAGGCTVAFLGSGLDIVYPRSSRELARRIPERGALLSEYPPGSAPRPFRFVQRNRLIASYTLGTLVVEAGARSGALITAGYALSANREVWAVPGDPRRPSCRGSNRLLRDGAGVVLDATDLLASIGLLGGRSDTSPTASAPPGLAEGEARIWDSLAEEGPASPEALARRTGLTAAELLGALSRLELAGLVERHEEGYALPAPSRRF